MGKTYSHPPDDGDGVLLKEHLADVADRIEYIVPGSATTPSGESLQSVVETLAYVHDFGKATTYFQRYLLDNEHPSREMLRYHAPLGSFAAYYALDAQDFTPETCLAGFVAVAKHHGQVPDVADYVYDRAYRREGKARADPTNAERRQNAIGEQIRDINDNVPSLADWVCDRATSDQGEWLDFGNGLISLLDDIAAQVNTEAAAPQLSRESLSASCYGLILQCWSALVLADKTSAAGAENSAATYAPDPPAFETLNQHVRDIEATTTADPDGTRAECLDYLRARARRTVLDNVSTVASEGGGVAKITLPTGLGKTFTGLSAALALRDELNAERVVYALPFTSVIDQVVADVETVYDTAAGSRLLTAHHHLTETRFRNIGEAAADEADESDGVEGMLAESWRAGLTVTTFVQLFESLAGPNNRQSMKLPALYNSVIVLDEPQSLPLSWWRLTPRLVDLLAEQYGATVITMTATPPQLFDDATPLVDDEKAYFDAVNRVSYELDTSAERYVERDDETQPKSYTEAATELRGVFEAGESALAVCNTIDSARELTEHVTEAVDSAVDVGAVYGEKLKETGAVDKVEPSSVADAVAASAGEAVLHLSTRLRPADRLKLVTTAKELTKRGHPLVAVSTQLVEAGVDISFGRVYRDLAPIDSIVQAAGRCNRSFEYERGQVTVWWLDAPGEQTKTPAQGVYNSDVRLLPEAAKTLASVRDDDGTLSEYAVAKTAVEKYYDRLKSDKKVGEEEYVDYVDEARGDDLSRLSLIDQRRTVDVLICRTPEERELVESIRIAERKYDFDRLKRLLERSKPLRVSVPIYRQDSETAEAVEQLPVLIKDRGLYELDSRQQDAHFDDVTGFVTPENSVDNRFL